MHLKKTWLFQLVCHITSVGNVFILVDAKSAELWLLTGVCSWTLDINKYVATTWLTEIGHCR